MAQECLQDVRLNVAVEKLKDPRYKLTDYYFEELEQGSEEFLHLKYLRVS